MKSLFAMKNSTPVIQPKVIKIDERSKRPHFVLLEDYSYSWNIDARHPETGDKFELNTTIHVKKGFRWDGASVPKILWPFGLLPDGKHRAAALIHDFIYIHKGKLPSGSFTSTYPNKEIHDQHGSFSRKDSDRLFGRMMKEAGVKGWKKTFMKWGVKTLGWIYWKDGGDKIISALMRFVVFGILITLLILSIQNGN